MKADDILFAPINGNIDIKLPDCWTSILSKIRGYRAEWSDATIAGGALRDLDLGRAIRDVDIFLPYVVDAEFEVQNAMILGNIRYTQWEKIEHDAKSASAITKGKPFAHFLFRVNGWKFEITQKCESFDHRTILDSFDLGICMISLDGDTVYRTPEYKTDVSNKTLTIVNLTGGREKEHAYRLLQKYEGWKIIQP